MGVVERTRAYRSHRNHPAFPTQWFTDYTVLSPVLRAFWPPSPALLLADLTPASGCQDHTTSHVRGKSPFVIGASASTASRPAAVTIATRPSVGRDGCEYAGVWVFGKAEIANDPATKRPVGQNRLVTPRAADPRRAPGRTRLRPDAAGRFFRAHRDRRACGRRVARGDSRAPTAAWSRLRRAAISAPANPAARWFPAPRPAPR